MRIAFSGLAALCDVGAITLSAVVTGVLYHALVYRVDGMTDTFLEVGLFIALLFAVTNGARDAYAITRYLSFEGHARHAFQVWNTAFVAALVFVFATKVTSDFSRATIVLFYVTGFFALVSTRFLVVSRVRASATMRTISDQRVFLVGGEDEVTRFTERYEPWTRGLRIVAGAVLRGPDTMREDLALAAASARMLRPDDIFVLLPWSQSDAIEACLAAFMQVPAAIHLGPERVLDRFAGARITRIGRIASLNLVRNPLTVAEVVAKRTIDLAASGLLLVALAPLLGLIALAIKLDSTGPVFFLQRRYGFNQEPFWIVKFRSMTTLENGARIRQATRDDPRVTRVGRFLRRFNLDELPQLGNVLRGDMSLVGPRPHALAHDQQFERTIADYARRHNVKPGITGWAQINGLRGETDTDEKMRQRIEHDLYYIDHWSVAFDLRILGLTLLSRKAFRNAV